MCGVVSLASASGIPKKFLVDPMRTWDQKFTPGLMLLTFMTVHLFQFRFADVVDAKTSVKESPLAPQGTVLAMTPPTSLASNCSYMSRNMVQIDGGSRTMLLLAHRIHVARRHAISVHVTTGALSIMRVKEIFTFQVGPMDQLTGSGIMMLGSSPLTLRVRVARHVPRFISVRELCTRRSLPPRTLPTS